MAFTIGKAYAKRILLINNRLYAVREIAGRYEISDVHALLLLRKLEAGFLGFIMI